MTSQELTIYHNPSCSKSRETLQILEYHKFLPRIIEYLDTPPSALEISEIVKKLGLAPIDLLRRTEKAYIDAKYQADLMTDQEINGNSEPFDGGPDHFYHVFNERDELTQFKKSSFNASIMELSRTTKSGYKKHTDSLCCGS